MDRHTVMLFVLAAIQAEGKRLSELSKEQLDQYVKEAIEDVRLMDQLTLAEPQGKS